MCNLFSGLKDVMWRSPSFSILDACGHSSDFRALCPGLNIGNKVFQQTLFFKLDVDYWTKLVETNDGFVYFLNVGTGTDLPPQSHEI